SEYSAVIPKFISLMLQGKSPTIYGDGETTRDFTYIDNVVNANLLACKSTKSVDGEHINIACGSRISLKELVDIIGDVLGKKIEPNFAEERSGDVKHSLADIEKAKVLLKYDCMRTVKEGIKVFVQNFTSVTQAMSERVNS
ncbi:MAG TPA: NAD-dependent epimerase/dehydratase family protein, partial [Saccharofermentans sp.]|nr:NAD-dependent epimerase/dehydratase family protein [Saccharofermentans sp.]